MNITKVIALALLTAFVVISFGAAFRLSSQYPTDPNLVFCPLQKTYLPRSVPTVERVGLDEICASQSSKETFVHDLASSGRILRTFRQSEIVDSFFIRSSERLAAISKDDSRGDGHDSRSISLLPWFLQGSVARSDQQGEIVTLIVSDRLTLDIYRNRELLFSDCHELTILFFSPDLNDSRPRDPPVFS
jgi:hypothetical protein